MPSAAMMNFSGMVPLRDPSLIGDGFAQYCVNAFLYRGTIRGFRKSGVIHALANPAAQQVYRIPLNADVKQDFTKSLWLEFDDPYITVLRAPMIQDKFKRYYFFPSTGRPYFNTLANLQAGIPGYTLGIPAPEQPPTVVPAPGLDETRSYLYTWVNSFGEEGQPSVTTEQTGSSIGAWNIGMTPPLPADLLNNPLVSTNLYRSVTSTTGGAAFYLVANLPLNISSYTDNFLDTQITNNLILPSTTFSPPPVDLQGVVQMSNGIMAGWSNSKEIWFSEPYNPHAWPGAYAVSVAYPIVGLAAVGSNLAIMTEGQPSMATGVTPGTMTIGAIAANEPCISRGSIVPAGEGVYYASPNGLVLLNISGTQSVTQNIMQKEDWINTNPYAHAGGKYAQAYVAFIKGQTTPNNGLIIDHGAFVLATLSPATINTPFSWLDIPGPVQNTYNDELSGQLFFIAQGAVYQWNPEMGVGLLPSVWRSKDWRFPYIQQFATGQIAFDVPDSITFTPGPINTDQNQVFDPTKQWLLVRVFADGRQVLVREVQKSNSIFKLPSGFKASYWSFQFESVVNIRYAEFATSVKEGRKT